MTVIVATAEERRQAAREAIRQAFSERPALTAPQVIEHDPEDGTALHDTTQQPINLP